jgi:FXSXX-COOH protein
MTVDASSLPESAAESQPWAPLVDVSGLPVTDLLASGDSALARSVQRLVRGLDDPNGVISAFSSFVS